MDIVRHKGESSVRRVQKIRNSKIILSMLKRVYMEKQVLNGVLSHSNLHL
jgi:hypothetical protein